MRVKVSKKGTTYYYYDHGYDDQKKRHWEPLGSDLKTAKIKWAQIESTESPHKQGTLAALADHYITHDMAHLSPKTQQERIRHAERLTRVFGHLSLDDIRPVHVAQYLDARTAKVAANREITLLSSMYRLAIRRGLCDLNPCLNVQRNKERPRDRYIEDHEFVAVRGYARPLVRFVMDLAYLTAMRLGDLLNLNLDQLEEDGIRMEQRKTKKKLLIQWTPELQKTVNQLKQLRPKTAGFYLICNRRGEGYTASGFKSMWQKTIRGAHESGVIQKRFTFHDIRAKAGTDADDLGQNAQKLLGHTTAKQTVTYLRSKKTDVVKPVR